MKKILVIPFTLALSLSTLDAYDWQKHLQGWEQYLPNKDEKNSLSESVYNGPTRLIGKSIRDLIVNGPAYIENCTLAGFNTFNGPSSLINSSLENVVVNGPLSASNVQFNTLEIHGPASFEQTTFKGALKLKGHMKGSDSSFQEIDGYTSKLRLINSQAINIVIHDNGKNKEQIVYLDGSSCVSGTIIFESGKGLVVASSTAAVGEIKGGKFKQ